MITSLSKPNRVIYLRFFLHSGVQVTRDFTEDEARSIVEAWIESKSTSTSAPKILGATSERDIKRVWGINAASIDFVDTIDPEELKKQQEAMKQQQTQRATTLATSGGAAPVVQW